MKQAIFSLFTETSLHAGTGQMTGVIDLPIQRESHTDWPCVYGSAVKGAMRMLADSRIEKDLVEEIFGPEEGNEYAGSIAVSDARLLPIRSLTGYFKWVTCPALLERLQKNYKRLGIDNNFLNRELNIPDEYAFVSENLNREGDLFLEEFRFQTTAINLQEVIDSIAQLMNNCQNNLHQQLVIVNNDIFSHLARYATPVNAHIRIDNKTKIVKPGALWYEETLPTDSLLYTTVIAFNSRKGSANAKKDKPDNSHNVSKPKSADNILQHVLDLFNEYPYLQLGGNETVGMDWCNVKPILEEEK